MNPRRITKKQLKEDRFVDIMLLYADKLKEHQRLVWGGLFAILIVVLALSWAVRYAQQSGSEVYQDFSTALSELDLAMSSPGIENYSNAKSSFDVIIAEYGRKAPAKWSIYFRGFCDIQVGDPVGAQASFEEYLAADPEGEYAIPARAGLAACLYSLGKPKEAADLLAAIGESESASSPLSSHWLSQAADLYLRSGYYDLAEELLKILQVDAEGAILTGIERRLATINALRS